MKDSYKEALEYMVKLIAENPDDVDIREEIDGTIVNLYIKANKQDYGTIIGRGGQMVQNIRKILTVRAVKDGVKINIKIDDDEDEEVTEKDTE